MTEILSRDQVILRRIGELDSTQSVNNSDEIVIFQSGATRKASIQAVVGESTVTQTDLSNLETTFLTALGDYVTLTTAQTISGDKSLTDLSVTGTLNVSGATLSGFDNLVQSIKESLFPIGSIYTNAANSTNPAILLGFGTWVAFGAGRVLVGVDTNDDDFNVSGATGGEKTHTLTASEMNHKHKTAVGFDNDGNQHFWYSTGSGLPVFGSETVLTNSQMRFQWLDSGGTNTSGSAPMAYTDNPDTGLGAAPFGHNNLQPYITVYMWQRTA